MVDDLIMSDEELVVRTDREIMVVTDEMVVMELRYSQHSSKLVDDLLDHEEVVT